MPYYYRNMDKEGMPKADLYDTGIPAEICLNCSEGRDCRMASNHVHSCPRHPEHDSWREKQREYKTKYRRAKRGIR